MNDLTARIEALIRTTDPDGTITVRWLARLAGLEHLLPEPENAPDTLPFPARELTVADVAEHFDKAETTIRDWLRAERFPGAYMLGREWRIPVSALTAFIEAAKEGESKPWAA